MLISRLVGPDLTRRAIRRGVIGGSGPWRVLALTLLAGRAVRRVLRRPPVVVATARLAEGSAVRVSTRRRGRRWS